jgi:hypothetical protein
MTLTYEEADKTLDVVSVQVGEARASGLFTGLSGLLAAAGVLSLPRFLSKAASFLHPVHPDVPHRIESTNEYNIRTTGHIKWEIQMNITYIKNSWASAYGTVMRFNLCET